MTQIENFIHSLQQQPSTQTVFNMYLDSSISQNLRLYLEYITAQRGKRILLVGEAPGYKGCRITGIPFTSGKLFQTSQHPMVRQLAPHVQFAKIETENSAKIVWEYLSSIQLTPLFWNSFPFHPHHINAPTTNRKPTKKEVEAGALFLRTLAAFYRPDIVAGIGRSGVACAQQVFPDREINYIRHPSFGGKSQFIEGMNSIMI